MFYCFEKSIDEVGTFIIFKGILGKLADIKIISDKIIN